VFFKSKTCETTPKYFLNQFYRVAINQKHPKSESAMNFGVKNIYQKNANKS